MKYLSFMILSFYSLWGYAWPEDSTLESSYHNQTGRVPPISITRVTGRDRVTVFETAFECVGFSVSRALPANTGFNYWLFRPAMAFIYGHKFARVDANNNYVTWNVNPLAPNCPHEDICEQTGDDTYKIPAARHCVVEYDLQPNANGYVSPFRAESNWIVSWSADAAFTSTASVASSPYNYSSPFYRLDWVKS